MSRTVSPLQVGGFVLVALFLALGMILFFSTTTLFSSTQTYILYFEDSVKGLSIGSSVKFKGVPIGQVKKIYISYNQPANSARIPVLIEIESEQLAQLAGLRKVSVNDVLQREIDNGLRAQLQMDSFITGLLFIDLNYFPYADTPVYVQQSKTYREIPTLPGPFTQLGNSANDIIAKLAEVDYEALSIELTKLAGTLDKSLGSVDFGKLSDSLNGTLESLNGILAQANKMQAGTQLVETMQALKAASGEFMEMSAQLNAALKGDSAAGVQIHRAAKNLSEAAGAIGRLADTLEQHPNSILTGKPTN